MQSQRSKQDIQWKEENNTIWAEIKDHYSQKRRPRSRTVAARAGSGPAPRAPSALPARVTPPVPPVVVRRCPGLMGSCSPYTPCCDPCATCHCRLFNTICHCWRMNHLCPKKT
ncbi:agouti-signaling protein 2b [Sardina pilchardus]|uniref:agouti-signaling protein 2b n=1 Tax=Sardina pilchardus TaxID=27697 RepID=UPI002E0FED9B